jgi:hypothetical protein
LRQTSVLSEVLGAEHQNAAHNPRGQPHHKWDKGRRIPAWVWVRSSSRCKNATTSEVESVHFCTTRLLLFHTRTVDIFIKPPI